MQAIQGILFAVAFLSLLATLLGAYNLRRRRAQDSWPTLPATVAEHQCWEASDDFPTGSHIAVIYLTYQWDGQSYRHGKLHAAQQVFPSRALAEAHLAAHPLGERHTLRVNPHKPSDAIVHPIDPGPARSLHRYGLATFIASSLALLATFFLS